MRLSDPGFPLYVLLLIIVFLFCAVTVMWWPGGDR